MQDISDKKRELIELAIIKNNGQPINNISFTKEIINDVEMLILWYNDIDNSTHIKMVNLNN